MWKHTVMAAGIGAAVSSILAAGVAWANIPGDGGTLQGCYTKVGGVLRVIDAAKHEKCLNIEVPISWNEAGREGDPGPAGQPGPAVPRAQSALPV